MNPFVSFDENCWKDLLYWSRRDTRRFQRILDMIDLMQQHPGKQNDQRIHIWAIDKDNDLIFQHAGKQIKIHSCRGLDPNEP